MKKVVATDVIFGGIKVSPPAINPSNIDFLFVAFDERIPNMPSQTCENAYFF